MADYIYLLQTRMSPAQQTALEHVRKAARERGMTVFLVGGAVRDLTTGSPIRDLDFAVQGDATKLKKDLQKAGGTLAGEDEPTQTLHFNFPGGVRMEVGSTLSATYPKPGKPVFEPANILDDLRRRDFTANAMAISLNDGSFGLLMDPLNGVADLENRELRLVSNYGFIEDPSRMIRAVRFGARLGWQLEEKTQQRYETGKAENYMAALNPAQRRYELEEVFHEEDPLRVLRRLEAEGWAAVLFPAWTSAKVNEAELDRLRDTVGQLDSMGIQPDPSAAYFPMLTAKMAPKDVAALKESFARPGFAAQIDALDADTKTFATQFTSKAAAAPSEAWKMLFAAPPERVLWLAHTTKSAPLQAKFKAFFGDWSQARQKIPYQLMQEMRITPSLPGYDDLIEQLFYAVMDSKLDTPEATKAFLEPFSPPAPPPPINLRRRAVKRETKPAKPRSKKAVEATKADKPDEADNPGAAETATTPSAEPSPKTAAAKTMAAPKGAAKTSVAPVKSVPPVKSASGARPSKKSPVKPATKPAAKSPAAKTAAKLPAKSPAKSLATKSSTKSSTKLAPKSAASARKTVSAAKKISAKGALKGQVSHSTKKVAVKASAKKPVKKATKPVLAKKPVAKAKSANVKPALKSAVAKPAKEVSKVRPAAKPKPKAKR